MKIHHRGYACEDIHSALLELKKTYNIKSITEIIFDDLQDAHVCMVEIEGEDNDRIELVSGNAVKNYIKQGISLYHVCYEVDDIEFEIKKMMEAGNTLVSSPKPAKLFNDRLVAFIQTDLGLIELLEKENLALLKNINKSHVGSIKVVFSSSFSMGAFSNFLNELSKRFSDKFRFIETSYNQLFQELINENSETRRNIDGFNIFFTRFDDWVRYKPDLENGLYDFLESYADELIAKITLVAKKSKAHFLLYICPSPPSFYLESNINVVLVQLRKKIKEVFSSFSNIHFFAEDNFINFSKDDFYDEYSDSTGHLPFTELAEANLAMLAYRNIFSILRRPYKGIILDCDNTLWNGVVSEDGVLGVHIDKDKLAFQEKILGQFDSGLLLFICSKNNAKDVDAVFFSNSNMLLKKNHISSFKVNWESKSKNIQSIIDEFKISAEDLVFFDDNMLECKEVESMFPSMLVLNIPQDKNQQTMFFNNLWLFDKKSITKEDKNRSHYYKQELERMKIKKFSSTHEEYLESLRLEVDFITDFDTQLDRVVQLTERTNQFNFSGQQYNNLDIEIALAKGKFFWAFNVKDRFGDYGLVGLLVFYLDAQMFHVENFILSCRVLGRGVENYIFNKIINYCVEKNIKTICICMVDTGKNLPAFNFLKTLDVIREEKYGNKYLFFLEASGIKKNKKIDAVNFKTEKTYIEVSSNRVYEKEVILFFVNKINSSLSVLDFFKSNLKGGAKLSKNIPTVSKIDVLTEIWENVLSVEYVNENDNFISLGGTSIDALRVISKINKQFSIACDISDIFNHPVLIDFYNFMGSKKAFVQSSVNRSKNDIIQEEYLASYNQKWLWVIDRFEQGSWFYNMPLAIEFLGDLDFVILRNSFEFLINRHSVLRTVFKEKDGEIYQEVLSNFNFEIQFHDVKGWFEEDVSSLIRDRERDVFNLSSEILIKIHLFIFSSSKCVLLLNKHHIVSDGWSDRIIFDEVSAYYNFLKFKKPLKVEYSMPVLQFFDFTEWQRKVSFDNELMYWKKQLSGSFPVSLKKDYPSNAVKTYNGKYVNFLIHEDIFSDLNRLALISKSTLFCVFISIFDLVVSAFSGESDISVGTVMSRRLQDRFKDSIGFFANTVVLRTDVSSINTFSELLARNRQIFFEAHKNQNIPFSQLLDKLHPDRDFNVNPFFDIFFAFQDAYKNSFDFEGVVSKYYHRGYNFARMNIVFEIELFQNSVQGGVYYNVDLFKEETIQEFIKVFCNVAKQVHKCFEEPLSKISFINFDENKQILSLLKEATNVEIKSSDLVFTKIKNHFKLSREKLALDCYDEKISYGQLEIFYNIFSNYLIFLGLKKSDRVVVLLDKSKELIVSFITCLNLGLVYIPVDPSYPFKYIEQILQDSTPSCIIHDGNSLDFLVDSKTIVLNIENIKTFNCDDDKAPSISIDSKDVAYMIYTSGTTGVPKGVVVSHYQLANLFKLKNDEYNFSSEDVVPLVHSHAFDFSIWEMLIPLCYGGTLIIFEKSVLYSPSEFMHLIIDKKITVLNQTPSFFKQFTNDINYFPEKNEFKLRLRLIIFGGEALFPGDLKKWFEKYGDSAIKIYNMYGNTETTVHSSIQRVKVEMLEEHRSIIGQGIQGVFLLILDNYNRIMPCGAIGEICVVGANVAIEYFHKSELSKKVFIEDFFNTGFRAYKTGDMGSFLTDGRVEFLGRIDKQVKLRGYRIELSHIESVAKKHEAVQDSFAVVSGVEDKKDLFLYVVPKESEAFPLTSLLKTKDFNNGFNSKLIYVLENGLSLFYLNRGETNFAYKEIRARLFFV